MEILEGIHWVDEASSNMAHSNVYLAVQGNEITVIDTGTSRNAKKIVAYIQKIGLQPSEVTAIVLTHFHMDHVGSAKELKDLLPNAKIAMHDADADYVLGEKPMPKPKNLLLRAVSPFIKPVAVKVEVRLRDGDRIGQLKVIHTPGHTPGSIALLDEEWKALFVGDTLRFDGKKVSEAPEHFSLDPVAARESIGKIAALNFEVMLPGHGEPLRHVASEAVKKFYHSLT